MSMRFKGKDLNNEDYCKCNHRVITTELEEFGYWDVCCECGKPIEQGYHYYNHYDGEDHEEFLDE